MTIFTHLFPMKQVGFSAFRNKIQRSYFISAVEDGLACRIYGGETKWVRPCTSGRPQQNYYIMVPEKLSMEKCPPTAEICVSHKKDLFNSYNFVN